MKPKETNEKIPPELERYLAMCKRAYIRMVVTQKWPFEDEPDFGEEE